MNRRTFLGLLTTTAATAILDPEFLLWKPGAKTIILPPVQRFTRVETVHLRLPQRFILTQQGRRVPVPVSHRTVSVPVFEHTKWTSLSEEQRFAMAEREWAQQHPNDPVAQHIVGEYARLEQDRAYRARMERRFGVWHNDPRVAILEEA